MINRRHFLSATAVASTATLSHKAIADANRKSKTVMVAAFQYAPVLGDVESNLSRVERLIDDASQQDAKWIVLPEFFTSGLAVHPLMFDAVRPIDGSPAKFLIDMAKRHGIYIGGSFLASSERDVFNTFMLASPDGKTVTHDKDFPSFGVESSFYAAGDDEAYVEKLKEDGCDIGKERVAQRADNLADGVMSVDGHTVGVALCWELVRFGTTRRLDRGKIEMLLGASGWWWSSPEFGWPGRTIDEVATDRDKQLALIREAPRRQARMLGVPVVHANFVGIKPSLESTAFDNPCTGRYLGQSQIIDAEGNPLRLLGEREEGVALAEVELGPKKQLEVIPDDEFWIPEVNTRARKLWASTGVSGRDYYLNETRERVHVANE